MTPERDQQIMDIFLAAIELSDQRRARYLEKVCGGDQDLHREIDSLLQHHIVETPVATRDNETLAVGGSVTLGRMGRKSSFDRLQMKARRSQVGLLMAAVAACFAILWYVSHQAVQSKLRQNVESQLQTVLNADVAAIEIWLAKQRQAAENWANHQQVQTTIGELARQSAEERISTSELQATDAHAEFLQTIGPLLSLPEVTFVGVFARDGHGIAKCPEPPVRDVYWSARGAALISPCFRDETIFMPTFRRGSNVVGGQHGPTPEPAVSFVAPVKDESGHVIAAMQIVMEIDREFAALFSLARIGTSGESYAFDADGVVLTNLRQDPELRRLGLIPEQSDAALHLRLRDPGIDLRQHPGASAKLAVSPLCKVPALAIAEGEASDSYGYRNYLGVNVIGAARWLPEYQFGVITEIEQDEAFAPVRPLSWWFGGVFALFAGAATLATVVSVKNSVLRKQVKEIRSLGQYTLNELVGQGGMAKVYRASHRHLRRPTAIKLIVGREVGYDMVARFEREVQLASELTHPNTVQIFDYGRTDDGVFYYAMEYLPGVSLADLVNREGPLSAARVIHILRQVCASLSEAHQKGLIHRDIKPANIMLCERGGHYDFVKVLDFGLVKDVSTGDFDASSGQDLTGTPLYIAPEIVRREANVDTRSDIYSLATVAFFLLTGEPLFDGDSSMEVLYQVVNETPRCPSDVCETRIPAKLDELVISCLAKDPQDRPADIRVVMEILEGLSPQSPWTNIDAERAWRDVLAVSRPACVTSAGG
jgi:hypothetical protein